MMHRYALPVWLLIVAILSGCVRDEEPEVWSLGKGDTLPVFSVRTLEGGVVENSSFAESKGVIIFFTTTCGDCRRELPRLEEWYRTQDEDFLLICISRGDDADAVSAFWKENGLTMPVAADPSGKVYALFATRGVPRLFLVENGIIAASYVENFPAFAYLKKHL